MQINSKALVLWMSAELASLGSAAASSPIYLAQLTCLDTMSCCIQRAPLTAAQRCGTSPAELAEALNGAKVLHDATQPKGVTLKEEVHAQESAQADAASEASDEPPDCKGQNHHSSPGPSPRNWSSTKPFSGTVRWTEKSSNFSKTPPVNSASAPRCPVCGDIVGVGMRPWLPPYQGEVKLHSGAFGGFIDASGDDVLISERMAEAFRAEGLTGLHGFHPVEVYVRDPLRLGPPTGAPEAPPE